MNRNPYHLSRFAQIRAESSDDDDPEDGDEEEVEVAVAQEVSPNEARRSLRVLR